MIGGGQEFKCGRQLSAWLGRARPIQLRRQQRLGHITKAGDLYLRMLLILGARSVLQSAKDKTDGVSRWAVQLVARV
jgi:transposase